MGKPLKKSDQGKPWNRDRNKLEPRAYGTRAMRTRFLIVCEGEKTEPNYFRALEQSLPRGMVEIRVEGVGDNTRSLMRRTKETRDKLCRASGLPFNQVWAVFDRDSFPADDFDNAIHMAKADKIRCAWSNEAFELWYLLHFEDRQAAMDRTEYGPKLTKHLRKRYKKNDEQMYKQISKCGGDEAQAIRRATRLEDNRKAAGTTPAKANPCTTVYLLVEALRKAAETNPA